jgi:hypothetical protein
MLAAGVDIVVVSKRLGHSSVAITSDTYTHLLPGVGSAAAARAWALVPRDSRAYQAIREQFGLGGGPGERPQQHRRRSEP